MAYTGASARKKQLEAAAKARLIGAHGSGSQQSREHSRSVGGTVMSSKTSSLSAKEVIDTVTTLPFRFLDLPAELRVRIYEYCVVNTWVKTWMKAQPVAELFSSDSLKECDQIIKQLAISRVSRLLRQESVPIFYSTSHFFGYLPPWRKVLLCRWLGSLTDDVAASLNTVELSVRGFLPVGPRLSVTLRPNSKEIPVMTLDNHQLPSHRSILAAAKGSTPLAVDAEARLVSTWYRLGLRARNATGQDLVELVESIFGIEF